MAHSSNSPVDWAPGLERAFEAPPLEREHVPCVVQGRVPDFVRGRYYLNGPARFERGGQRYRHWLDGDGCVVSVAFDAAGAHVSARFVRSDKWRDEQAAGQPLYRAFGTAFADDRLLHGVALASPANVSVLPFAGRVLAFGEQGLPWDLDPVSLETRGPYTFDGALNVLAPFSAHPKRDRASGELWNFGVSFARNQPTLNLYRFDAGGQGFKRMRAPLDLPISLHDFALAPRHAVFHLGPYLVDMDRLARPGGTLMQALRWEPERGTRLLVLARDGGQQVALASLGHGYCLHTINAFERADGCLVVDFVELERPVYDQYEVLPDLLTDAPAGHPVRVVLDLERQALVSRTAYGPTTAPDFPAIDPRLAGGAHDDVWLLDMSHARQPGRKFFDELVHVRASRPDWRASWRAPTGYLGGEPLLIPGPGERQGALLCPLFDAAARRSSLLVFDAFDVAIGPCAQVHFAAPIQLGFHAAFDAAHAFGVETATRQATEG